MYEGVTVKVVVPALNEERAIGKVLADMPDWVDEVVVVDNGSTDRTAAVAAAAGALVVEEPRRGYGQACLAGMAAITWCDIVVFLDADYSDFPEQMDRLVRPIVEKRADMVLGHRKPVHGGHRALTLPQRFGTGLACALMRLLWGRRYRDMGPFRALRWPALLSLHMHETTYGWTVEMQIKALLAGLRVLEVPVDYRPRIGVSKISGTVRGVWGAGTKILGTIGRYLLRPPRLPRVRLERLVVFSRWPSPGTTKTRLIPALGPLAAADLQRRMTERTVEVARQWADNDSRDIVVQHAGGTHRQMCRWLGPGLSYRPQSDGDLGRRMCAAFRQAFSEGCQRAILIGTDCPGVTSALLEDAAAALDGNDLVLGPTRDGGYWLIGIKRPLSVFDGVPWSTDKVLEHTLERARCQSLEVHLLPMLTDVDLPEDLGAAEGLFDPARPVISVVVPARNEAHHIEVCLDSASVAGVDVIVVDGTSADETAARAAECGARVIPSAPGRARQQNLGAVAALADTLLFLHADTILPADWQSDVFELLLAQDTVGGGFLWRTDMDGLYMRAARFFVNFRTRYAHEPWGDQAIFVRRDDFESLGGFPDVPIGEDRDLVLALQKRGRMETVSKPVLTSGRRWRNLGVVRSFLTNRLIVFACQLGLPRNWLRDLY